MRIFLTNIIGRLKAANHARKLRYDKAIRALELVYLGVIKKKKTSLSDAVSSTINAILAHSYLPEFYLLLAGFGILAFSIDAFAQPGINYGLGLPIVVFIGCIFGGFLALGLSLLTMPFHLLAGVSLWLLTGIHVVMTSVIFSTLQPSISRLFLDEGVAEFQDLFLPILTFFGLAEFYLLSRLHSALCFHKYQARHRQLSIESVIPTDMLGEVISISAQDHYVEISTDKGRHLERMTMKKAVGLMPEAAGLQVHRSHWVAYNSILDMEKTGERYEASLRNGAKIPVGKTNVADVFAYLDTR